MKRKKSEPWVLRILETPQDMATVEELQRLVWPGNETDVVPVHILVTIAQNGGVVIGAFEGDSPNPEEQNPPTAQGAEASAMIGFVYGFPGLYFTPDGPRPKHCSHQLGVHPEHRSRGVGFALKRAQWQMVRHQGLDLITWTYDPLLSRNAHLNIARLGAVCNTYVRELYGDLQDELNRGMLTDRFRLDWWVNSRRVERRLSRRARAPLDLAHFLSAEADIINPTRIDDNGWPHPLDRDVLSGITEESSTDRILLVEIPSDYLALKAYDNDLALEWRLHSRTIFEGLFARGYLITDFVYLPGAHPRSFYVLSHGESTL